jgi:tripartite-type tricarboxylate transporter receptor subunit TctC
LILGCATAVGRAHAAEWPERPLTLVVPFPAGGSSDVVARIYADALKDILGKPLVVENRAGANGNIGSAAVARSAPDGYTLLLSGNGQNAMNHSLYARVPYDSRRDFTHISQLASISNALVVAADSEFKSLPDFLAAAKGASPFTYGSPGAGSSGHLAMAMLQRAAGLNLQHVPYRGAAPLMTDLLGKHVPIGILNSDNPLPHVRDGKMRILAVTGAERSPLYPDTPTVADQGFPGFLAIGWMGLSAPAGTPKDIVERLHAGVVRAAASADVQRRLTSVGYVPKVSTPDDYAAFVAAEIDKWARVVKDAGISIE